MSLSEEGKEILDHVTTLLEIDRPMSVKIAFAKGLAVSNGAIVNEFQKGSNKWVIPEGIIKGKEFLLFKHLIINEINESVDEDEIHQHMLAYIEKGLRIIYSEISNKTSIEDLRLTIL